MEIDPRAYTLQPLGDSSIRRIGMSRRMEGYLLEILPMMGRLVANKFVAVVVGRRWFNEEVITNDEVF